jgi:hypothetical protein
MFMLIAGLVILFNICSASIIEISRSHSGISAFSSKKEQTLKKHVEANAPAQLIDIEENNLEIEEREERSETKFFHPILGFISSGAAQFEESNGLNDTLSFSFLAKGLSLFIVFENFRL